MVALQKKIAPQLDSRAVLIAHTLTPFIGIASYLFILIFFPLAACGQRAVCCMAIVCRPPYIAACGSKKTSLTLKVKRELVFSFKFLILHYALCWLLQVTTVLCRFLFYRNHSLFVLFVFLDLHQGAADLLTFGQVGDYFHINSFF
jgi:hypothetical protein